MEPVSADPTNYRNYIQERYLASLVSVLDDVAKNYPSKREKVIVNMSFGWIDQDVDFMHDSHWVMFSKILKALDDLHAVLVAASHNRYSAVRDSLDGWPSRWAKLGAPDNVAIRNLIVVSGIDQNSVVSPQNPVRELACHGPWLGRACGGYDVHHGPVWRVARRRHHSVLERASQPARGVGC